jgi:hypothetical protein
MSIVLIVILLRAAILVALMLAAVVLNFIMLSVCASSWTNLRQQDETKAEFSTLDVGVLVYDMQLHS